MKLLINGEYKEIGFWSFVKCIFLAELWLTGIVWILYTLAFLTAMLIISIR
jgi:hypothetical protein